MLRPGRTIELVEATDRGRPRRVRARVWLLSAHDTATVAGGQPEPLSVPDAFPAWVAPPTWGGGYIGSLEMRRVDPAPDPVGSAPG